jgi:aromatic ring hydroxylase
VITLPKEQKSRNDPGRDVISSYLARILLIRDVESFDFIRVTELIKETTLSPFSAHHMSFGELLGLVALANQTLQEEEHI